MATVYAVKRFSVSKYEEILKRSLTSCRDLIKCMEFYDKAPEDIIHWVQEMIISEDLYRMILKEDFSCMTFILACLSEQNLSSLKNNLFKEAVNKKVKDRERLITNQQASFLTEKDRGEFKYKNLLGNPPKFKYTPKYYLVFFDLLSKILSFEISLEQFKKNFIELNPKTGDLKALPGLFKYQKPKSIKESKCTKEDLENLIYGFIFILNKCVLTGHEPLDERLKESIK